MWRLLLALTVVLAFLAGRAPAISPAERQANGEFHRVSSPNTDLYGNEVERAVGGYRVDLRGDLYEEHNPDTAVLKLGPPSS
jgi:hypothetical protein